MLVDSHCHIDIMGEATLDSALSLVENARDNGVEYLQCVSINLDDYPKVIRLAEACDNVFASVGIHPNDDSSNVVTAEQLVELAVNDRVISIGETGLDYFRSTGDLEWQKERFRQHIIAAREIGKPLVVHIRNAFDDAYQIMVEEKVEDIGGVVHCFTENLACANKIVDLGFYVGITGIVTFKTALEIKEVAANIPIDRLLIETDSPYLAPVPYRGKRNEPAYVKYIAEHIAELRGETFETIANATTLNFFNCFNLELPAGLR